MGKDWDWEEIVTVEHKGILYTGKISNLIRVLLQKEAKHGQDTDKTS